MSTAKCSVKTSIPIFGATNAGLHLVIAGGGGGKQFGIPNAIKCLEMDSLKELDSLDTGDSIYFYLRVCSSTSKLVAICESEISFFSLDSFGKLNRDSETPILEILDKDSNKNDEFIMGQLFQFKEKAASPKQRLVLITEFKCLVVLDLGLKNLFQLRLNDLVSGMGLLESTKSVYLSFKNGRGMVFSLESLKFTQAISADSLSGPPKSVYSDFLKGEFSRILKSSFFEYTTQDEEGKNSRHLCGIFTFRNRKSRILFISEVDSEPSLKFQDLGEFQLAALDYYEQGGVLIIGTAEGHLRLYRLDLPGRSARLFKILKPHHLPIRKVISKSLLPPVPEKKVSSKKTNKDLQKKEKAISRCDDFVVWSFSVDYSVSIKVVNLQKNRGSLSMFSVTLVLIFLLISILIYFVGY